MIPFKKILWVKSVSLGEGELAYGGRDRTVRAREPKSPGDEFELHATPEDADSLADPEVDDLLVLVQHDQATHLVRVVGDRVVERSRRTMRKGTRDERFSVERTCALVILKDLEEAPWVEDAFGFDPGATGGEVFRIDELPAFVASGDPLWLVQRRILVALEGPSIRKIYATRGEREAARMRRIPKLSVQDFLRRDEED